MSGALACDVLEHDLAAALVGVEAGPRSALRALAQTLDRGEALGVTANQVASALWRWHHEPQYTPFSRAIGNLVGDFLRYQCRPISSPPTIE